MLMHLWTISLEEQFYLFWPIIFFIMYGDNLKPLFYTILVLLIFTILMRLYIVLTPLHHPFIWTGFLTRLDPFALGAVLAVIRSRVSPNEKMVLPKIIVAFILFYLTTLVPAITVHSYHVLWVYLISAIACCLILDAALSSNSKILDFWLSSGPIVWMGKLCFGLYVFHLVAIRITLGSLESIGIKIETFSEWAASLLLALSIALLLAFFAYKFIEKPFLKLKTRFTHVKSRPI